MNYLKKIRELANENNLAKEFAKMSAAHLEAGLQRNYGN